MSADVVKALRAAGRSEELRNAVFDALRREQAKAADPMQFKNEIRWPIVEALLEDVRDHTIRLANGLVFTVSADSRIERALLLSDEECPDHIWEPQTTRLLVALGRRAANVIIGGAYIGDQALFIARALADDGREGRVHAFEPMAVPFEKLQRNIAANGLRNVIPQQLALWSSSHGRVHVEGAPALASSRLAGDGSGAVETMTIDDYAAGGPFAVDLIMLDTEGGEEEALRGASRVLETSGPDVVFEIHRSFVDWSAGIPQTSIVRGLTDRGYEVFAIRDFHDNHSMAGQPIELVPADSIYLEGPPHGFNMFATRRLAGIAKIVDIRIVRNVSPKLLLHKDPQLHHPLHRAS
jgi:FkbM family methyltransferase